MLRSIVNYVTWIFCGYYVFANTTDWLEYESIQADLFDHFLAMITFFGLRVFQNMIDRNSIDQQLQHSVTSAIEESEVAAQESL